jgi:hypothetical protein
MDIDLAVPSCRAGRHLTGQIDRQDVVIRNLIEPDAVRLHEEMLGLLLHPHRDMAARHIPVPQCARIRPASIEPIRPMPNAQPDPVARM